MQERLIFSVFELFPYDFLLFLISDQPVRRMVDERVKLCDECAFQCSICYNEINDQKNVCEIGSCHCQFCTEVFKF